MKCKNFLRRAVAPGNRRLEMMENSDRLYRDVVAAIASSSNVTSKEAMRSWAQTAIMYYTEDVGALWTAMKKEGLL